MLTHVSRKEMKHDDDKPSCDVIIIGGAVTGLSHRAADIIPRCRVLSARKNMWIETLDRW
jgi:hypothetical protein